MLNRPIDIAIATNIRNQFVNAFIYSINEIAFFATMLKDGATSIFSNPWVKYLNGPLTIATSFFSIILSWRLVHLTEGANKLHIWNALIETLVGGAMIAAAIGVIASIAAFAFIAPIIIAAGFAVRTLYSFGAGIYQSFQAANEPNEALQTEYRGAAKNSFSTAFANALMMAGTITLILVAAPVVQTVIASIGLTLGIIGALVTFIAAIKQSYDISKAKRDAGLLDQAMMMGATQSNQVDLTNNASLAQELGVTAASAQQIEKVEMMLDTSATKSVELTAIDNKSAVNEPVFDEQNQVATLKM